jgi:GH15 family glucan-1,4-alpha-glucosidase
MISQMPYLSLSDYGLIGNSASSALVSRLGSIDWCCFPDLDSPSHFGAILDDLQGGRFQIMPQGEFRSEQKYLQRTQVLETTFETPFGRGVLLDWMPIQPLSHPLNGDYESGLPIIYRKVEVIQGKISWLAICTPRFSYGRDPGLAEVHRDGVLFRGSLPTDLGFLRSSQPIEISANGSSAISRFTLEAGEKSLFTWQWGVKASTTLQPDVNPTLDSWRNWAHRCDPTGCNLAGPWHDTIARSALTLKLLMHPSGSIAEAVTTSIPGLASPVDNGATTGASRTWDYRFAWIRDEAQAIQALANLGYRDECNKLFQWLCDILTRDGVEGLQPVYRLDGGKSLPEDELNYLSGYQGARPVRVGNLTSSFFQLDIYGHVMLAACEYYRIFKTLPPKLWHKLMDITDYVCQAWRRPDHGPWEMRSKPEHFTASKLYCWAAIDRAIWLAERLGERVLPRWNSERDILYRTILNQGYDSTQSTFVRAFGDQEVDSAALLIPILGFLPIDDPRVMGTIHAVETRLGQGVLIRRYEGSDGIDGQDACHLVSSLLFVSCLALAGRVDEAGDRLAEICTYATPLGMFGEQVDPQTGETTGNFPCASVHIGLINAGLYVGAARGKQLLTGHLMGFPKKSA